MFQAEVTSKPLRKPDLSAALLQIRALKGDPTYAVNFDCIQFHKGTNRYQIYEYQKCEIGNGVTPHTSHPNYYWDKCHRKYEAIWRVAIKLGARLWVINYADEESPFADQIKVIQVKAITPEGLQESNQWNLDFEQFSNWYRRINLSCR